ncbi:MAG: hypothetical protein QOJ16_1771, partial [Acidobacteriota bacterium]|nr:hypothetical protein [Acidobacteriota bacterium]
PLYATVIRVGAKSPRGGWDLMGTLAAALAGLGSPGGNSLIPVSEGEGVDLEEDLILRQTHRSGLLLSADELLSLVHLPPPSIRLTKLKRQEPGERAPPPEAFGSGVVIGENRNQGRKTAVRLPEEVRGRHLHVLGASGMGKSTLLLQMICQDIEAGRGVGVLDPHGDLVDEILGRIPPERWGQVALFDPSDEEYPIGWNILAAHSQVEKQLLASDLVGIFRRLSTSWGDQMTSVLANAILVFLEAPGGGTLLDLKRFLTDRLFREKILSTVPDPYLVSYWREEFPLLKGKPVGPIATRLDGLLRMKVLRNIVAAPKSHLDLRRVVDGGVIFLGKLSAGAIGQENAALLGSLLVSGFHQAALSRQELLSTERRSFNLYIDECQHFATPSMAALLSGVRKYRLALTVAHQELSQLKSRAPEVESALLGNAGTRIVFRVGEEDARRLEKGFSVFTAADLVNLGVGEALCRIDRADHDFNLRTIPLPPLEAAVASAGREAIRKYSRERYGRRLEEEASPPPPQPPPVPPPPQPAAAVSPEPAASRRVVHRAPVSRQPKPPAPLGRGGPEHQYLQELLKRFAEAKGYRVTIEEPILEGRGSVDVALVQGSRSLACEISVTSTVEQEVGNVEKCLSAGFSHVAVVSLKSGRLKRIRAAVEQRLGDAALSRVSFVTPEEFATFLDSQSEPEAVTTVGGYKVKVKYRPSAGVEAEASTRAVAQVIARSLVRLKGKSE